MDCNRCNELFDCTMCGNCCRGYGGTYLTEQDLINIASYTGKDIEDIRKNYCDESMGRYMIGQKESGYCLFWDKVCKIHPVKPKMCREWPYIQAVLKDPSNWKIMASSCPGMKPDSKKEEIILCVREKIFSPTQCSE